MAEERGRRSKSPRYPANSIPSRLFACSVSQVRDAWARWTIGRERSACLMTRFMIHSGFSIAFDTLRHAFRFECVFALRLTAS